MSRRYLTLEEADAALCRGKSVECFLGSCSRNSQLGIKWMSIRKIEKGIKVSVYESADLGNVNFADVYEFGPLNPDLESDEPDEVVIYCSFEEFLVETEKRYTGSTNRLVNESIIQDEYVEYKEQSQNEGVQNSVSGSFTHPTHR